MKKTYAVFLFLSSMTTLGQTVSYQEVMNSVRKVADHVTRNTTYFYYDTNTGDLISDLQKYGYNKNIIPQSGYNEWRYWTGVIHIGFNALGKETKEFRYMNYTRKNFEFFFRDYHYLKPLYDGKNRWTLPLGLAFSTTELDDCGAMGASLIELYMTEKKDEYKTYIDIAGEHILKRQMRLPDGIFARPKPYLNTVWADDLYMSVPFLARMGKLTGDKIWFDEAARQVILFNKYLFDEKVGLMWHCYYGDMKVNGGTFWGRCNGWMMMATADLLLWMPQNHHQRDTVIALLIRQIRNTAQYQSQSGLWHQVLNKQDSYLETSCTAMFTYATALAINNGWLDERYKTIALSGWEGIASQITREGAVTNICMGTGIGDDIKFYYERPAPYNDPHGIGAVILAGLEVCKLVEKMSK